jgi:hypothetical protein
MSTRPIRRCSQPVRRWIFYSKETLDRVDNIRKTLNYSYLRGEGTLLDVLETQRTASQTQFAHNQTKANYLNALWVLQSAVGKSF